MMQDGDDEELVQDIIDRLSAQFPRTSSAAIVDAVTAARHHFARGNDHASFSVLVEREAKARLERPI